MREEEGIDATIMSYDALPERPSSPTGKRKFDSSQNTQKKKPKKFKILVKGQSSTSSENVALNTSTISDCKVSNSVNPSIFVSATRSTVSPLLTPPSYTSTTVTTTPISSPPSNDIAPIAKSKDNPIPQTTTTSITTSTLPQVIFKPTLLSSSSSKSLLSYAFRTSTTTKPLISTSSETPQIFVSFPIVSKAIICGSSPPISNLTPTSDFNIFIAIISSNKPTSIYQSNRSL
ncbi:uncharacterized protein PB18E9.04c-like [Vicia villosa]|uniref:uncharacterized protein PB18E9.04c-like n=1 Tax=Vicia villosa TaxID=3911 RepID=UPI00273BCD10|nr:uncharacterized protein PB18E9.04c-like [Vicia villosa]